MNNRMDNAFNTLKAQGKKALVTFVTAGDPDLDATYDLVLAMEEAGASLIELGIPFSDPMAEGPVIQAANVRALKNGVKIDQVFNLVARLREKTQIPLVFLMYANCIYRYGKTRFFERCRACGIDGVILPDLPFDEQEEFKDAADSQGIYLISLIAPTSGDRIGPIARNAAGFLYCVSSLGVTGVRENFATDLGAFHEKVAKESSLPAFLGFGVSGPEAVKTLKGPWDGLIVGSAIVRLIEKSPGGREAVEAVKAFTYKLREALDG